MADTPDIVERLRAIPDAQASITVQALGKDAAAEITRLRSVNAALLEALEDHFAEIEDAIATIQGSLRHRQQPQDVTFFRALKAARDGRAALALARESQGPV